MACLCCCRWHSHQTVQRAVLSLQTPNCPGQQVIVLHTIASQVGPYLAARRVCPGCAATSASARLGAK